jgi:hypothetical protein
MRLNNQHSAYKAAPRNAHVDSIKGIIPQHQTFASSTISYFGVQHSFLAVATLPDGQLSVIGPIEEGILFCRTLGDEAIHRREPSSPVLIGAKQLRMAVVVWTPEQLCFTLAAVRPIGSFASPWMRPDQLLGFGTSLHLVCEAERSRQPGLLGACRRWLHTWLSTLVSLWESPQANSVDRIKKPSGTGLIP